MANECLYHMFCVRYTQQPNAMQYNMRKTDALCVTYSALFCVKHSFWKLQFKYWLTFRTSQWFIVGFNAFVSIELNRCFAIILRVCLIIIIIIINKLRFCFVKTLIRLNASFVQINEILVETRVRRIQSIDYWFVWRFK